MRIELNAGGIRGITAEVGFSIAYDKLLERHNDVVSAFKAVKSEVNNMSGGAGVLESAVEKIEERITKTDEKKIEHMESSGQSFAMFLKQAVAADKKVASNIAASNAQFYKDNPWAIPPKPKSWWQKVKDFFKKVGKAIVNGLKKAVMWVVDKVKSAVKATIAFIKKHWKAIVKIVIGVVVIAGLAALSVFTGGTASVLLAAAAKAAATCALTSAATTVVKGVAAGQSFGEIFDAGADSFMTGAITGAVSGAAGAAGGAVLSATGSTVLSKLTEVGVKTAGDALVKGTRYLIDNGTLSGFWDQEGKGILMGAASGCASACGSYLKETGAELLKGPMSSLSNSELGKSFQSFYQTMENKVPTLTKVVTNTAKDFAGSFSISDLSKLNNPSAFAKELGNRALGSLVSNAKAGAGEFITKDLNNLTGGAVDNVMGKVSGVTKDISNAFGGVTKDIGSVFGGISSEFKGVTSGLSGALKDAVPSIQMPNLNIGSGLLNSAGSAATSYIGNKIGIPGNLGQVISSGFSSDAKGTFQNLAMGTSIKAFDKFCGSGFAGSVGSSISKATNTATSVISGVTGTYNTLSKLF